MYIYMTYMARLINGHSIEWLYMTKMAWLTVKWPLGVYSIKKTKEPRKPDAGK